MVVPNTSERERLRQLIEQKDALEARIEQHGRVLRQQHCDMHTPLVDADGFPRSDCDVLLVRNARHQIICLQNDRKALLKDIEAGLHALHAQQALGTEASSKMAGMRLAEGNDANDDDVEMSTTVAARSSSSSAAAAAASVHTTPFARVAMVHPNSPAARAGLRVDDTILEFGSTNAANFSGMAQIGDIVKHSVDRPVRLRVQRGARSETVQLLPTRWQGDGLLGCLIVPT